MKEQGQGQGRVIAGVRVTVRVRWHSSIEHVPPTAIFACLGGGGVGTWVGWGHWPLFGKSKSLPTLPAFLLFPFLRFSQAPHDSRANHAAGDVWILFGCVWHHFFALDILQAITGPVVDQQGIQEVSIQSQLISKFFLIGFLSLVVFCFFFGIGQMTFWDKSQVSMEVDGQRQG